MTRTIKAEAVLAMVAAVSSIFLLWPTPVESEPAPAQPPDPLTQAQHEWVAQLRQCESSGSDAAVNPKDLDGTPSLGRFQFKPSTFSALAKRYGLASTTDYMNGSEQQQIVEGMILDPTISDWELAHRQFPDCIQNHIGLPPR